ncbi:hypothetical protein C8R42DRAFT_715373 [Lentinula raphanica]|nr:hypothetical protein C8R42DRAFT_715373 [Lentinula raphanica]
MPPPPTTTSSTPVSQVNAVALREEDGKGKTSIGLYGNRIIGPVKPQITRGGSIGSQYTGGSLMQQFTGPTIADLPLLSKNHYAWLHLPVRL